MLFMRLEGGWASKIHFWFQLRETALEEGIDGFGGLVVGNADRFPFFQLGFSKNILVFLLPLLFARSFEV